MRKFGLAVLCCFFMGVPALPQAEVPAAPVIQDSLIVSARTYHDDVTITSAELRALPHTAVTVHNSHTNADAVYQGVRVTLLFEKLGTVLGKELHGRALLNYVVATGSDKYSVLLAIAEIDPRFHPGDVVVADSVDGHPLDAKAGPFQLIVSEDKHPSRSVRNLVRLEMKSAK